MNVKLFRTYRFEAAHHLGCMPDAHPCGNMHGHSYKVELGFQGPVDPSTGWLIDFGEIDGYWEPLRKQLDHNLLNNVPDLGNPTCENLCKWIWDRIVVDLPQLARVTVWEMEDARCEYEGE